MYGMIWPFEHKMFITQNGYEMSITPALILLCRINITKFPQAQYFDDKQKLFVRSSINLNC